MKRILTLVALFVLAVGGLCAQNSFKGIVKYTVESTGTTAFQVPEDYTAAEVKVMGNKVLTTSPILLGSPMVNSIMQNDRKLTTCLDYSMLFRYIRAQDVPFDYNGSDKLLNRTEITQLMIDSLTIPCTEGYYIEYVAGETQKIAGWAAKKAIIHSFDKDGEDHPTTVWYTDEMGPEANFLFNGIKGVALQFSQNLGEGKAITITANEVVKGKVKDIDFLLPDGYVELSEEEEKALGEELETAMELLNEE